MGKRSREEELLRYERIAAKVRREIENLSKQEIALPQSQGGPNSMVMIAQLHANATPGDKITDFVGPRTS